MARRTYGAEDARARLPELLEKAHGGVASVITKRGKPYAALVPPGQLSVRKSSVMQLRGSGRGLWGKQPARTIQRMRDEWL
jgi:prevent-host-death family protein